MKHFTLRRIFLRGLSGFRPARRWSAATLSHGPRDRHPPCRHAGSRGPDRRTQVKPSAERHAVRYVRAEWPNSVFITSRVNYFSEKFPIFLRPALGLAAVQGNKLPPQFGRRRRARRGAPQAPQLLPSTEEVPIGRGQRAIRHCRTPIVRLVDDPCLSPHLARERARKAGISREIGVRSRRFRCAALYGGR